MHVYDDKQERKIHDGIYDYQTMIKMWKHINSYKTMRVRVFLYSFMMLIEKNILRRTYHR